MKVPYTFTGHLYFVEKRDIRSDNRLSNCSVNWIVCRKKCLAFVQAAKLYAEEEKSFLIGTDSSYLTVILPAVEPMVGGECG